jgi:hypothetical protein
MQSNTEVQAPMFIEVAPNSYEPIDQCSAHEIRTAGAVRASRLGS